MAKVGRPTTYKEEYCDEIIEHMKSGKSLASFAASLGTHRQVIYQWMDKNEEFKDACKAAQELSQIWWEEFAMQAASGRIYDKVHEGKYDKHNPNMIQFMMSRRFKDFYRDKQNKDDEKKQNFNISVSYDPTNLEDDELTNRVAHALKVIESYERGIDISASPEIVEGISTSRAKEGNDKPSKG